MKTAQMETPVKCRDREGKGDTKAVKNMEKDENFLKKVVDIGRLKEYNLHYLWKRGFVVVRIFRFSAPT